MGWRGGVVVIGWLLVTTSFVRAQGKGVGALPPRPQLSPYLNQLRGINPAVNYYFGLAAQTERRAVQLERPVSARQAASPSAAPAFDGQALDPRITGHGVQFMNYAPYFNLGGTVAAASAVRGSQKP
jgi:hypothetical protein